MGVTTLLIHKYYWRPADFKSWWSLSWAPQPMEYSENSPFVVHALYVWKFDSLFSWLILVTVVGPLLALFTKKEEKCLFLLIEIIVRVLTAKQLAQTEEVFLWTCFNELKRNEKNPELVCRTETESNSVKQNAEYYCKWTKVLQID